MEASATVIAFMLCSVAEVLAYPNGAPSRACALVYPSGHTGHPRTDDGGSAYLNVSQFSGGVYVPGESYTLILESPNAYTGLLVQGRLTTDGMTPVGAFSATQDTKLSSCSPAASAVTHKSNGDKVNVTLLWTAPSNGTGPVTFHYAVVVDYEPIASKNTFYATLKTASINELTATLKTASINELTVSREGEASVICIRTALLWMMALLAWQVCRLF